MDRLRAMGIPELLQEMRRFLAGIGPPYADEEQAEVSIEIAEMLVDILNIIIERLRALIDELQGWDFVLCFRVCVAIMSI